MVETWSLLVSNKVLFMLNPNLESMLKPVDEQYRETMNQMKDEQKGKRCSWSNEGVPL